MLFNSYEFLVFLPLVLCLYWAAARRLIVQNMLLVAASYVFYAWWDIRFLLLIAGMTATGYLAGLGIARTGRKGKPAGLICGGAVTVCLGVLGAFKYYDFFVDNFNALTGAAGSGPLLTPWHVVLPVGISFYTFQVISYVIDVKRGSLTACRSALSFAAFVSFFPQLVAGPIERATSLLPQMQRRRSVTYAEAADGLRQILWGFTKKMLLADRCAPIVNAVYANPQADGTDLWAASVLFAFQIYGDFSGYSDIAIGTARLFGIRLTRNFSMPYFSRSIIEFWRRWHISLMTWFKDYLYIPLGGSHCGRRKHLRNLLLVFLTSGLWHGSAWTFVGWGLYPVFLFVPLILFPALRPNCSGTVAAGRLLPQWKEAAQMVLTFLLVVAGWVIFRSATLGSACVRIIRMLTDLHFHPPYGGLSAFLPVAFVLLTEWIMRNRRHGLDLAGHGWFRYRAVRWACYYMLILAVLYWGGGQVAFIYFQF